VVDLVPNKEFKWSYELNPNLFVKIESELKYACQDYGHFVSIKQKQRQKNKTKLVQFTFQVQNY